MAQIHFSQIFHKMHPTRTNYCDMPDSDKVVMTVDESTLNDNDRRNSEVPGEISALEKLPPYKISHRVVGDEQYLFASSL
jgi:hypothetical protein